MERDCLVAVLNNDADLHRCSAGRLYRIPDRIIGRGISREALAEARALAFYQTAAIHNGLPGAIELWGEIEERLLLPRREIIPEEPDHPAAGEPYHLIRLKSVERLSAPVVSRRPRRITFIRTTRDRLLQASDLNDLIIGPPLEEKLWNSLRAGSGDLERRCLVRSGGVVMEVDIVLFQGERALGIHCGDDRSADDDADVPDAWVLLRFSPARLDGEFDACLKEIGVMADRMAARTG